MKQLSAVLLMAGVLAVWAPALRAADYPADNSGKNARDREGTTLTSGDQSNNKADVTITQKIRREVVADKRLSMDAHNVKIITINGVVTLRGPVKSAAEKANIGAKAKRVAGVTRVDNQLEVATD